MQGNDVSTNFFNHSMNYFILLIHFVFLQARYGPMPDLSEFVEAHKVNPILKEKMKQ